MSVQPRSVHALVFGALCVFASLLTTACGEPVDLDGADCREAGCPSGYYCQEGGECSRVPLPDDDTEAVEDVDEPDVPDAGVTADVVDSGDDLDGRGDIDVSDAEDGHDGSDVEDAEDVEPDVIDEPTLTFFEAFDESLLNNCPPGEATCMCESDDTCDAGLTCIAGHCQAPGEFELTRLLDAEDWQFVVVEEGLRSIGTVIAPVGEAPAAVGNIVVAQNRSWLVVETRANDWGGAWVLVQESTFWDHWQRGTVRGGGLGEFAEVNEKSASIFDNCWPGSPEFTNGSELGSICQQLAAPLNLRELVEAGWLLADQPVPSWFSTFWPNHLQIALEDARLEVALGLEYEFYKLSPGRGTGFELTVWLQFRARIEMSMGMTVSVSWRQDIPVPGVSAAITTPPSLQTFLDRTGLPNLEMNFGLFLRPEATFDGFANMTATLDYPGRVITTLGWSTKRGFYGSASTKHVGACRPPMEPSPDDYVPVANFGDGAWCGAATVEFDLRAEAYAALGLVPRLQFQFGDLLNIEAEVSARGEANLVYGRPGKLEFRAVADAFVEIVLDLPLLKKQDWRRDWELANVPLWQYSGRCNDHDADGYGWGLACDGPDCDDNNPNDEGLCLLNCERHSGAREVYDCERQTMTWHEESNLGCDVERFEFCGSPGQDDRCRRLPQHCPGLEPNVSVVASVGDSPLLDGDAVEIGQFISLTAMLSDRFGRDLTFFCAQDIGGVGQTLLPDETSTPEFFSRTIVITEPMRGQSVRFSCSLEGVGVIASDQITLQVSGGHARLPVSGPIMSVSSNAPNLATVVVSTGMSVDAGWSAMLDCVSTPRDAPAFLCEGDLFDDSSNSCTAQVRVGPGGIEALSCKFVFDDGRSSIYADASLPTAQDTVYGTIAEISLGESSGGTVTYTADVTAGVSSGSLCVARVLWSYRDPDTGRIVNDAVTICDNRDEDAIECDAASVSDEIALSLPLCINGVRMSLYVKSDDTCNASGGNPVHARILPQTECDVCGDSVCSGDETYTECPSDCLTLSGEISQPTGTRGVEGRFDVEVAATTSSPDGFDRVSMIVSATHGSETTHASWCLCRSDGFDSCDQSDTSSLRPCPSGSEFDLDFLFEPSQFTDLFAEGEPDNLQLALHGALRSPPEEEDELYNLSTGRDALDVVEVPWTSVCGDGLCVPSVEACGDCPEDCDTCVDGCEEVLCEDTYNPECCPDPNGDVCTVVGPLVEESWSGGVTNDDCHCADDFPRATDTLSTCRHLFETRVVSLDGNLVTFEFRKLDRSALLGAVDVWVAVASDIDLDDETGTTEARSCRRLGSMHLRGGPYRWEADTTSVTVEGVPVWPSSSSLISDAESRKSLVVFTTPAGDFVDEGMRVRPMSGGSESERIDELRRRAFMTANPITLERECSSR